MDGWELPTQGDEYDGDAGQPSELEILLDEAIRNDHESNYDGELVPARAFLFLFIFDVIV